MGVCLRCEGNLDLCGRKSQDAAATEEEEEARETYYITAHSLDVGGFPSRKVNPVVTHRHTTSTEASPSTRPASIHPPDQTHHRPLCGNHGLAIPSKGTRVVPRMHLAYFYSLIEYQKQANTHHPGSPAGKGKLGRLSLLKVVVDKDPILSSTYQVEHALVHENVNVLPGNESRVAHIHVHGSHFAVSSDNNSSFVH